MASEAEEKCLKTHFSQPVTAQEKCHGKYATAAAAAVFFKPTKPTTITNVQETNDTTAITTTTTTTTTPINFCKAVSKLVADPSFQEKHKAKSAPLAIMAFAEVLVDKITRPKHASLFQNHFNDMTIVVPPAPDATNEPHYHSIVGQKLLLVDWKRVFGIDVPCPDPSCSGMLNNVRSNYSKNKTLFPMFRLDGAPSWCTAQKMTCACCHRSFDANENAVLLSIPQHTSNCYPVEPKCALTNHSFHLERNAAEVMDSLMLTYANGELCSRLLHNTINRSYLERITLHYSYHKANPMSNNKVKDCIKKMGCLLSSSLHLVTLFETCAMKRRKSTIVGE